MTSTFEEFKVGDQVKILSGYLGCNECSVSSRLDDVTGLIGKVCKIGDFLGINFGRDVGGHGCNNTCPDNFGQFLCRNHVTKNALTVKEYFANLKQRLL